MTTALRMVPEAVANERRPQTPARILIVDDDPTTRRVLRSVLASTDLVVIEAASGREAAALFEHVAPDLVVLDVQMPDGDGFEACTAMRALDPDELVPIIMLSVGNDDVTRERALRVRATDFLAKPFDWRLLQQRVRVALESRRLATAAIRGEAQRDIALRMSRLVFFDWRPDSDRISWSAASMPLNGNPLCLPDTLDEFLRLLSADDAERVRGAFAPTPVTRSFEFDATIHGPAGRAVVHLRGKRSQIDRQWVVLGAMQDVTTERSVQQLAEYRSQHDALTGLGNRLDFVSRISEELRTLDSMSNGSVLLVGWFDITRLQRFNDALGHNHGDELLRIFATRLSEHLGADAVASRIGGDEFAVAFTARDQAVARERFASLVATLQRSLTKSGDLALSFSAGCAMAPEHGQEAAPLIAAAEAAQRAARAAAQPFMVSGAFSRESAALLLGRERDLRRSVAAQSLYLAVQPQIDARSGRVVGAEALVRWRDAAGQEVPPAEFIPMLEECDLIFEVGEWCLREACRWQRRWEEEGVPLRIAVNLSPRQLANPTLTARVAAILRETSVAHGSLELELTESVAMQRPEEARVILQGLRDLGVRVAIDDFGVGYSSLAYLVRFPIDSIKLDREFIRQLVGSREVEAIIRAAVALAEGLGLSTVAEGVETQEQASLLRTIGVSELQGYLIARPMPPERMIDFIRTRHADLRMPRTARGALAVSG